MTDTDQQINLTYSFHFEDGRSRHFEVNLTGDGFDLVDLPRRHAATWTELEFKKCTHCPLTTADTQHCPIARNLEAAAHEFADVKSYVPVRTSVRTRERVYMTDSTLQESLQSLFGLIMATSRCPYTRFLRPMARFHLPFSTLDETMVRSTSLYLLKQFFRKRRGESPDYDLKELELAYTHLQKVNMGIISRIRSIAKGDAEANSLVILDGYAQLLLSSISVGLSDIEVFFKDR